MKFIGNILWMLLGGIIISFYYALMGLLFCLTIIGIPASRAVLYVKCS